MKKKDKTFLTEDYLTILTDIEAAAPKDFFYERLINRLENEQQLAWVFPLKPIWMICTLMVLLLLNIVLLSPKNQIDPIRSLESIEGFAKTYDQQISSY